MAYFYCVGFPDLSRTLAQHGHVSNHEVFTCKQDAEKANEGLITCVHEFYVKDSMFASTIERLNIQRANFIANMRGQKMITGKLVDAAGKPREPFITGYATMNEAYLALQESWPIVTERNHNSMILADQQGCRLILQECKA